MSEVRKKLLLYRAKTQADLNGGAADARQGRTEGLVALTYQGGGSRLHQRRSQCRPARTR